MKRLKGYSRLVKDFAVKNKRIISIFLFIFGWTLFIGYFLLSLTKPLYQDEGVFLTIGKGLATGKLPYLNYWDHKPPGIYFIFSVLYPLFGTKIILYKLFIWLINLLTGLLVFLVAEKLSKGSGKLSILIFLICLIFFEGNYLNAGPFLGFFGILSVWFVLQYPKKLFAFVGSGVSIALAIVFKQTAVLGLLPITIYVIFKKGWGKLFYLFGLSLPIALTALYLNQMGVLQEFWKQMALSSNSYPPEPIKQVLLAWLDVFKRVWWLWPGVIFSTIKRKLTGQYWLLLFMALLPVLTFFVRSYSHYWLQVLPYLAVLSGMGWHKLFSYLEKKQLMLGLTTFIIIIIGTTIGNLSWYKWITENKSLPREKEQKEIVAQLDQFKGSELLAENRFTGFYFFTDKEPLNKYLYLTEVNESENARQTTLSDLESSSDVVILWPKDQKYVYAREIGEWLNQNCKILAEYPVLDLVIYQKN